MSLDFDTARLPDPNLRADHEDWRTQLRRFVDAEIMPHVDAWDEACTIPDALWAKAAAIGLLQLGYPEEYGGISEGIDIYHQNIVAEELARTSLGGINSTLLVHGIGLPPVVNFASAAIKQQVIPPIMRGQKRISLAITEPSGGSDVASIRTTARRDGDHYVVDGSKTFISGGMGANWFTTAVRTGGEGARGVSVLLVPADCDGVSRTPLARKQGWWCSDTATIYFDEVRVPAGNLIGTENSGFLVIMANFNNERMAMAVGMEAFARVCLEEAVNWARERRTFGKRLADHQVIRHKIAQMKQRINATQAYIQLCSRQIVDGNPQPGDIALLKVQASETMEFCAREAMQVLGGAGYMRGNRVERIYREVRVNAIGGGSEEIMRDLAARQFGL
ncbi:MAG: acyl-CoA dehydrogenase family protein [Pseudomonadales bacterium]|jgi:acyl-CoA dehydrogenase|nr:acyl-CoA dehydrogenase family protein [Gammaproteobacteria bacterium]MBP6052880.1 acyl-CoA dehydrogenase family protein [Pseudomonadales bacterium]MBK7171493.1 acyl-CoA dehydrogenase family protein [Gammaproteobacteria bacterium]MBK7521343.1 acyl-CoA dehydrogenase family protein [Gammaproteobacteria bacterium]MBK8307032.1 acyl-CoA dehydrogenase family protein [Gammaproteobacteria bacterium]